MALTARHNSRQASGSGSYNVTTASFTLSSNCIAVVVIGAVGNGATINTANSSLTTSGLTWTKRTNIQENGVGGYNHIIEIWTAEVTSGGSFTVNWVNSTAAGDNGVTIHVVDITGYDTGSPIGATAAASMADDGAQSITLSGTPATDSIVFAARIAESTDTTEITATEGTDWTEIYDGNGDSPSGYASVQSQYRTGLGSTTVPWQDVSSAGSIYASLMAGAAVEIKMAAAAADLDQASFRFYDDDDTPAEYAYGTTPVIETADVTSSGNNTASNPSVTYPAYSTGDLLIQFVAVDQNRTITPPSTGPDGETIGTILASTFPGSAGPALAAIYWIATAGQSSSTTAWTLDTTDSWDAQTIRVPAGEFDPAKPIDVISGTGSSSTDSTVATMPAFTADRPNGRVVAVGGVDADPMDATFSPTGWTDLFDNDRGAVCSFSATRDAATTAGETIAAADFGINPTDSYEVVGFVVNAPISEAGATPVGAANANASLDVDTTYRWHARVENSGGATTEDTFKVQYKHIEGTNTWTDVSSSSDVIRATLTSHFANGDDIPEFLGGSGTYVTNNNAALESSGAATLGADLDAGEAFELELSFQVRGADVDDDDTIQLRIVYSDGTALDTYTNTPTITAVESGGASAAVGAASGAGAASATGAATTAGVGSATGDGTADAVGASVFAGVGAASGIGAASGDGLGVNATDGAAAGVGDAAGVGAATADAIGTADGTGDATAGGESTAAADGAADGHGDAAGVGAATADAVGSAVGAGDAAAAGETLIAGDGVGAAAGTGDATAIGAATAAADGAATGAGGATAVGAATADADGAADGAGASTGVGASVAAADGAAAGTGDATGDGLAITSGDGVGSAAGSGEATGVGAAIAAAAGTAAATGEASGVAYEQPSVPSLPAGGGGGGGYWVSSDDDGVRETVAVATRALVLHIAAARSRITQPDLPKIVVAARPAHVVLQMPAIAIGRDDSAEVLDILSRVKALDAARARRTTQSVSEIADLIAALADQWPASAGVDAFNSELTRVMMRRRA